jgi:hypothetical protein
VTNSFNEEGTMITKNKYFKVEKCTEEFFTSKDKTGMRKNFFDFNKNRNFYCTMDPEAYI